MTHEALKSLTGLSTGLGQSSPYQAPERPLS